MRSSTLICWTPFQSTPSGGKATSVAGSASPFARGFNPRLPGGRRRATDGRTRQFALRFNPRLPGGRRPTTNDVRCTGRCFNPRLPGGRRLSVLVGTSSPKTSFNPRLPGGRRHIPALNESAAVGVSIHAFRGEGDTLRKHREYDVRVSIHAFRGEGDRNVVRFLRFAQFQSTPSGGKATPKMRRRRTGSLSFNPRLPGGRRR